MFDIGFLELALIALVSLLVLGPERLPVAARKVGLWVGRIRRFTSNMSQEIDRQLKAEELREKLMREGDTLGVEKIQGTVRDALKEADDFKHLVNQDVSKGAGKVAEKALQPASAEPSPAPEPAASEPVNTDPAITDKKPS